MCTRETPTRKFRVDTNATYSPLGMNGILVSYPATNSIGEVAETSHLWMENRLARVEPVPHPEHTSFYVTALRQYRAFFSLQKLLQIIRCLHPKPQRPFKFSRGQRSDREAQSTPRRSGP